MSSNEPKPILEEVALSDIHSNPHNPKQHSETQIIQIEMSIRKFGWRDPVTLSPREGGGYDVVEGHGRLIAARRIGMDNVPAVIVNHLSEDERRAYGISHNQTQQNTELDSKIVASEFERLGLTKEEQMAVGFTEDDMMFLDPSTMPDPNVRTDHNGFEGGTDLSHLPPVYKTSLVFKDEEEQAEFEGFLDELRHTYLDRTTLAERLIAFVGDHKDKI